MFEPSGLIVYRLNLSGSSRFEAKMIRLSPVDGATVGSGVSVGVGSGVFVGVGSGVSVGVGSGVFVDVGLGVSVGVGSGVFVGFVVAVGWGAAVGDTSPPPQPVDTVKTIAKIIRVICFRKWHIFFLLYSNWTSNKSWGRFQLDLSQIRVPNSTIISLLPLLLSRDSVEILSRHSTVWVKKQRPDHTLQRACEPALFHSVNIISRYIPTSPAMARCRA